MMKLHATRWIPQTTIETRNFEDVSAVAYVTGPTSAIGYSGKRNKPDFHFRFRSEESRDRHIEEWAKGLRASKEAKELRQATKKNFANPFKLGDILHYSWGWEQTNCEFYQVVGVSGKMVTIQQIAGKDVGPAGPMSTHLVAVKDAFCESDPIKKRVQTFDGQSGYLSMDHGIANLWTGKPMCDSWYA